jgi:4-amino-4-deoxy-L-arabinose transferase-like glycosyltransferase
MLGTAEVLLPLIGYLAIFQFIRRQACEFRRGCVGAAVVWGVYVTLVVELLSLPHLLTRFGLTVAWLLLIAVCACLSKPSWRAARPDTEPGTNTLAPSDRLDGRSRALLYGVGLLAALIGVTAVLSPPNTGDVLFYHMPRIVMWISRRSVHLYPTLNYAQLIYGPWAEYAMLHLYLLYGGDRLVNLIQWFAYLGSAISVSLIAGLLGAKVRGQILAAAICCAIPVAVLEASGAKNNCVVALWLAACVYFLLEFGKVPSWSNTLGCGAAAALAILTKATAYFFLPTLFIVGWWLASRDAKMLFLRRLPILAALVLALNGPLYVRNVLLTRSPTGVGFGDLDYVEGANHNRSIEGIAANVVRNVAIQISLTDRFNAIVGRWARGTIRLIGQDPDDPRTVKFPDVLGLRFQTNPLAAREDMTGVLLHFVLMSIAAVLALVGWRNYREAGWYAIGVIASFVCFCALVRWERWGVRYQIPLLALESALIGVMLDRYLPRVAPMIGVLLIIAAVPFALRNELRPLLPFRVTRAWPIVRWSDNSIMLRSRADYYFADLRQDLQESYVAAAEAVGKEGCKNIGLDISFEDSDYLFTAFLNRNGSRPVFTYSGVYNLTRGFADASESPPCAVVCFACSRVKRKWAQYRKMGGRVSTFGDIAVFSAAGRSLNSEMASPDDDEVSLVGVASGMQQHFEAVKDVDHAPEFSQVLARAQGLAGANQYWTRTINVGLENINRTRADANMIMLYTTRIRKEAGEGVQLAPEERRALMAADEALVTLAVARAARIGELRNVERAFDEASGAQVIRRGVRSALLFP